MFLENMVEFYEPIDNEDKERIFLSKHQLIFADYKKHYLMQRYFLLVELARIFSLTLNTVSLHNYPITQSILNVLIFLIYDYNLIRYCYFYYYYFP